MSDIFSNRFSRSTSNFEIVPFGGSQLSCVDSFQPKSGMCSPTPDQFATDTPLSYSLRSTRANSLSQSISGIPDLSHVRSHQSMSPIARDSWLNDPVYRQPEMLTVLVGVTRSGEVLVSIHRHPTKPIYNEEEKVTREEMKVYESILSPPNLKKQSMHNHSSDDSDSWSRSSSSMDGSSALIAYKTPHQKSLQSLPEVFGTTTLRHMLGQPCISREDIQSPPSQQRKTKDRHYLL